MRTFAAVLSAAPRRPDSVNPTGRTKSVSGARSRPDIDTQETSMPTTKIPSPAVKVSAKRLLGAERAESPAVLIDAKIKDLSDWRGEMLSRLRVLIKEADPEVTEEWKWNTPVWSHNGIICTGETYKKVVKMTFAKGASLLDPSRLFNSSLEGNVRRAIDFHEGAQIDEEALKELIRAAVAANESSTPGKSS
jgi:hypothetical protein